MVKKYHRLARAEFTLYLRGRRYNTLTQTLIHTPTTGFKVAVVVSKKVAPTAVMRNCLRRRLFATVETWGKINTLSGVYIFVLQKPAATATRMALYDDTCTLLVKIAGAR